VIARIRILVLLTRPAVVVLLGLFAMTGVAQAGAGHDRVLLMKVLVVVVSFLLFSVVLNDLADEAIDRVNLAGDRRRPLVAGSSSHTEFVAIAVTAGVVATVTGAMLSVAALAVVLGGLALSASYSLRPVRIADRGAVASMLLPAGYVAVPYLVGIFSVRSHLTASDLVLLGGLYVGFIGRILLKDFRDVRGDALFGKRTFLVRYGRRRTCQVGAVCWIAGTLTLAGVRGVSLVIVAAYIGFVGVALGLLRALSVDRGARRDEAIISSIAIIGRGMVVTLIGHLSMTDAHWSAVPYLAVMATLAIVMLGQAAAMARRGPTSRLTVPEEWVVMSDACPSPSLRRSTSTISSSSSEPVCSTR
jgi:4-hydroxybenzoate polyprenyltransferase